MKDASNQNAGSITYNSDTNELRFAAEGTQLVWNRFYSSRYSVSGQSEDIAVANIYDPIVKIQEVSEKEESTLTGGMFRLYRLGGTNGNTKQYYLTKSTSAAPEWGEVPEVDTNTSAKRVENGSTETKALSFTTDDDGIIEIGAIPKESTDVIYYLEEVTAPNGYNKLTKPVTFIVKTDGTVVLQTTSVTETGGQITVSPRCDDAVDNTKAAVTFPDPYYMVTVRNTPGIPLPFTGGMGGWWLFLLGAVLISMAAAIWRRRKGNAKA